MKNIQGILYVIIGASSYGVLATIIKLANHNGFTIDILTFLQFGLGFLILSLLAFRKRKKAFSVKSKVRLSMFGTALGLTSCFYYLSIQYVPVSIGIVFLMQAIWLSVVLELILTKKFQIEKWIGAFIVIFGTLLAVNAFDTSQNLSWQGILYGGLASVSYTMAVYASNKVELDLPNILRSKYLVLGGFLIILIFWNRQIMFSFKMNNPNLWKYGILLAVFGTIIPPMAFNKGFPITGLGLGSIIASIEIPVSVLSAKLFLNETIDTTQWLGILLIMIAVVMINIRKFSIFEKIIK